MKTKLFRSFLVLAVLLVAIVPTVLADNGTDSSALREAVTLDGVRAHQAALQTVANNNGGTRVAGTAGHDLSAAYVRDQMLAAGYNVSYQPFTFPFFQELTPATLAQTAPGSVSYTYLVDFFTMDYSGSADVTAAVQAVDLLLPPTGGSTSGCDGEFTEVGAGGFGNIVPDPAGPDDFAGFTPGNIALIQRGTCTFALKTTNAEAAGASGVIIFNEGNTPAREQLFGGTLGGPFDIPVLTASFAFGSALNSLIPGLELHMTTNTISEERLTNNVIAETPGGRTDRVVVAGAHLDSVAEGPGIQDNGSGSAAILEIALQMAELGIRPRNQVRFIWFSAEESGLLGSGYYVSQLTSRQIKKIAVMLNFDMIGSPNFVRFVYDGDGTPTGIAGPNGSDVVEDVFLDYFAGQSLPNEPTPFSGRSDYGPFIAVGIPAGGLFTGAEGIKTAEEAAVYGGTAGLAYDECYHQACDDFDNISLEALDQMSDAAAHAVLTFAMTTSAVNGTDKGKGQGSSDFEYLGSSLRK